METTDFTNDKRRSLNSNNTEEVHPHHRNSYTIERSYCEVIQKNKPQSNSVAGGEIKFLWKGFRTSLK